ncbi:MAG: phosphatidylglycerol lysyltransferase domain-containing protein [Candidatus Adiutrix sp.]|jgi:hypothetical protein|nr:phosphatidylglycerol lysyltransferase domain-containing protein [Candidatus Adiutrix sp.]
MAFQTLTLADRDKFRAAEKSSPEAYSSEINFTNLFIWRSYYRASWAEHAGCLCLMANPEEEASFGLPPAGGGDRLAALDFTMAELDRLGAAPVCRRTPETLVDQLRASGRSYAAAPDRDNDDYVYLVRQLATLAGRRMHQKKNHYNYFIAHNQFECLPVTTGLTPELLAVQESWLATKVEREEIAPRQLRHEMASVREILEHLDDLNLLGLAIRLGGRLEGFTLGELVRPDTALVHLEKANPDIRGLFVALTSHFCRTLPPDVTYVNREQDLGLPGLRRSKESLKPDHLVRKFTITPEG